MNYRLIFQLSLYGLAMAVATVFWIPSSSEPVFWLLIFIVCAYFIALKSNGRYFLTGFLVSIVNCVWITAAHIIFFQTYLTNHPQEAEMMSRMPFHDSPRLMMLLTGPLVGIISGLILGLFSFLGSKILQKK
jgi:amino acid permease